MNNSTRINYGLSAAFIRTNKGNFGDAADLFLQRQAIESGLYATVEQQINKRLELKIGLRIPFSMHIGTQEWQEITLPVYQQFSLYPDTSQIITVPFDNATSPALHIGDTLVVVSKTLSNDVSDYLQGLQSYVTSEVLNSQYYNPPFYYSNGAYGLGYGTFIDTIYHVVGQ